MKSESWRKPSRKCQKCLSKTFGLPYSTIGNGMERSKLSHSYNLNLIVHEDLDLSKILSTYPRRSRNLIFHLPKLINENNDAIMCVLSCCCSVFTNIGHSFTKLKADYWKIYISILREILTLFLLCDRAGILKRRKN